MAWPLSQDYNEAVQSPASCFADPELKQAEAATNALGLPMPCSGNFADVYEMRGAQKKWAVKCFTREIPGIRERYIEISKYLQQNPLPFMVDFRFLEQGIRIRGQWYPILKMDWVQGFTLNQFVRDNVDKPQMLDMLCQIWVRVAKKLRETDIAHCDLQHGNIMLVPGSKATALGVRLIDYDGMCVPSLELLKSIEVGHPNFQHPQRLRESIYGLEVDRFPHLVIYAALRSLIMGGKTLWDKYDNGDNLLFKQADLDNPTASPLIKELRASNDPVLKKMMEAIVAALGKPLDQAPLLEGLAPPPPPTVVQPKTVAPVSKPTVQPAMPSAARVAAQPAEEAEDEDVFAAAGEAGPKKRKRGKKQKVSPAVWAAAGIGAMFVLFGVILAVSSLGGKKKEELPVVKANVPPEPPDKGKGTPPLPVTKGKDDGKEKEKEKEKAPPEPKPEPEPTPVPLGELKLRETRRIELPVRGGETAAFSQDGRRALLANNEHIVELWDLTGPKKLLSFPAHERLVLGVDISPDGKLGVSGSDDQRLRLLDLENGKVLRVFEGAMSSVWHPRFSRDGQRLVVGGSDGRDRVVYVWDVGNGQIVQRFTPEGKRVGLGGGGRRTGVFLPSGQQVLSAAHDFSLQHWNVEDGKEVRRFSGHTQGVQRLAISADGRWAASASPDRTVRVWDVTTGDERSCLKGHTENIFCVAMSPDGRLVLSGSADGLRLWDALKGTQLDASTKHGDALLAVAFTDNRRAISISKGGDVYTWDLATGSTPVVTPIQPESPPPIVNSIGMKLAAIPAGEFVMGSPENEANRAINEGPRHRVRITKPFHMGVYEVKQSEFERVMGKNPSELKDSADLPVGFVRWNDAIEFCNKLSELPAEKNAGRSYRLPTEAEWEYVCRAGTTTAYFSGGNEEALAKTDWYAANSGGKPHRVGIKPSNPWGLYDMQGNVHEWCMDGHRLYEASEKSIDDPRGPNTGPRALKGGGYRSQPRQGRCANRDPQPEGHGSPDIGFRIVCTSLAPVVVVPPKPGEAILNSIGMKLLPVRPGTFEMGSTAEQLVEVIRIKDHKFFRLEVPRHQVTLTKPFLLGIYEVTQDEYQRVMGNNPSSNKQAGQFPVDSVPRADAVAFCEKLSQLPAEKQAGRRYRLPTEAEWEYACRAGTSTHFHTGNALTAEQANTNETGLGKSAKAGSYLPNAWGFHDMHGNVFEWCQDGVRPYLDQPVKNPVGPDAGLLKGGSFLQVANEARSASRHPHPATLRFQTVGFRVVCEKATEPDPPMVAQFTTLKDAITAKALAKVTVEKADLTPLQPGENKGEGGSEIVSVPEWLAGGSFYKRDRYAGFTALTVDSDGVVVMAVSPRWKGGGNGNDWKAECKDRDELLKDGWKEASELPCKPAAWPIFWKQFKKGDQVRLRTEKYCAPMVLMPGNNLASNPPEPQPQPKRDSLKVMKDTDFAKIEKDFPPNANVAKQAVARASSQFENRAPQNVFAGNRTGDSWQPNGPKGVLEARWAKPVRGHYLLLFARTSPHDSDPWGKATLVINGGKPLLIEGMSGKHVAVFEFSNPVEFRSLVLTLDGQTFPGLAGIEIHGSTETADAGKPQPLRGKLVPAVPGQVGMVKHETHALGVAYSASGKSIATCSTDKTARLWNVATGREIGRYGEHSGHVYKVAFSPDGKTLALGCHESTGKFYDATSGKELQSVKTNSTEGLTFATNGYAVYVANDLTIVDPKTGKVVVCEGHTGQLRSAQVSPDCSWILIGANEESCQIRDFTTGKLIKRVAQHGKLVPAVALSRMGDSFLTGSLDGTVRLWDVRTEKELLKMEADPKGTRVVAFTIDGQHALAAGTDGAIRLFNLKSGKLIHGYTGHTLPVNDLAVSPDGQHFATASEDTTVRIWRLPFAFVPEK